jgi:hypothetical protein
MSADFDEELRECPWCAEHIKVKALVCRYCGRDVGHREVFAAPVSPSSTSRSPVPPESAALASKSGEAVATNPEVSTASRERHVSGNPGFEETLATPISGRGDDQRSTTQESTSGVKPQLPPLSGWLTLFLVGQGLGAVWNAITCYTDFATAARLRNMYSLVAPSVLADVRLEGTIAAMMLVGSVIGIYLCAVRDRRARKWWIATLGLYFCLFAWEVFLLEDVTSTVSRLGVSTSSTTYDGGTLARSLLYSLIWLAYWIRSKRVREIFGAEHAAATVGGRRIGAVGSIAVLTAAVLAGIGNSSSSDAQSVAVASTENSAVPPETARLLRTYGRQLYILDGILPSKPGVGRLVQIQEHTADESRGVVRLEDSELLDFAVALGLLYKSMPDSECASAINSIVTPKTSEALGTAIVALDSIRQDAFIRGSFRSLAATLRDAPPIKASFADAQVGFSHLVSALGASDGARLNTAAAREFALSTPAEECWAVATIYSRGPALLAPHEAASLIRYVRGSRTSR